MDKPDVDFIEGLSPRHLIDQKSASAPAFDGRHHHRGLRLPAAALCPHRHPHCPTAAGRGPPAPQQIVDRCSSPEAEVPGAGPGRAGPQGEYSTLLDDLAKQGFSRSGRRIPSSSRSGPRSRWPGTRSTPSKWSSTAWSSRRDRQRLTESIETAPTDRRHGRSAGHERSGTTDSGSDAADEGSPSPSTWRVPMRHQFRRAAPRSFSFNSPTRRPTCAGLGTKYEWTPNWWLPDESLPWRWALAPGRAPAASTSRARPAWPISAASTSTHGGSRSSQGQEARAVRLAHQADPCHLQDRFGRKRSYEAIFEGIIPWLQRRPGEAESDWSREQRAVHARGGLPRVSRARLKPESLAVTVGGRNIYELCSLPISTAVDGHGDARAQ